jgi:hypothetical protein
MDTVMSEFPRGLLLTAGAATAVGALLLAGCDSSDHHETAPSPTVGTTDQSATISAEPSGPVPGIRCEFLRLDLVDDINGQSNNFMARVFASEFNGASIRKATVDFGDGSSEKIKAHGEVVFTTAKPHHFAPGTYTVRASVQGQAAGKNISVTSENCQIPFTVGSN